MNSTDDCTIIKMVLAGNQQAFSILVERYQTMVYTLAMRLLKNEPDAEELTQDCFIKAYNSLSNFKMEAKFSSWLYRIVYNTGISILRKKRVELNAMDENEIEETEMEQALDALEQMEEEETRQSIKHAVNRLNETDAMIISLYYFEEYTVKEISDSIQLSESNIKIRLYRARKQLFSELSSMMKNYA